MENSDLDLGSGDVEMIQRLLDRHVENEASHKNRSSPSSFMVTSQLRDLSPNSFNPQVVSIGPLHRDDVKVQAFEGRKSSYLISLMGRMTNNSQKEIWKSCMQKSYASMNKIKTFYDWPKNKNYSDAEIAEMMVIDACFILEFTYQLLHDKEEARILNKVQLGSVMNDLVLLENQIPLFILDEIHQCTILEFTSRFSLSRLIRPLLYDRVCRIISSTTPIINIDNDSISTAPHILSLLHQCFMPLVDNEEVLMGSTIPSAKDLAMAGVKFKPSQNPTWVMGIEMKQYRFPYSPALAMPVLKVEDSTELILRNLIAYEHFFNTKSYVTSYFDAMDMLVNTQEDVAKLVDSRVLINLMGSNEEVANIINNLGKNVTVSTRYEEEWKKVNKYCNHSRRKHIAKFWSTYFRSPWTMIALIAAIFLFGLQVVQTIFAVWSS